MKPTSTTSTDNNNEIITHKFKLLTIGESHVGKTSLLKTLTHERFDSPMSTIGIDVVKKYIKTNSKNILLQIWDTAGQERFRSITRNFYRDADGILLIFDVTDLASFHAVDEWLSEINPFINNSNNYKVPIYLVGNKNDLLGSDIAESRIKIFKQKAESLGVEFYIASAKTGLNVCTIFEDMSELLVKRCKGKSSEYVEFNTNKGRRRRRWGCF